MALQDALPHNYQVLPPTQSDLTGFKPGVVMLAKHVLSGSDLGVGSHWVVNSIDESGNMTFTPVSARSMNSTRSRPLAGLIPYAARGLHTTKSYFEPTPTHTNANI